MEVMISGSPRDIEFVRSVCRAKVRRGLLRISPVVRAPQAIAMDDDEKEDDEKAIVADDTKGTGIVDDKYPREEDNKDFAGSNAVRGRKTKKTE